MLLGSTGVASDNGSCVRSRAKGKASWKGCTPSASVSRGSRLAGVDVYGVESFYIPYFYAMADQIGANVAGLVFLRRRTGSLRLGAQAYLRHPVMLAGLGVILAVPTGLLVARLVGFSPTTQVLTALETILANLCWLPPLVGAFVGRRRA
jgi:hypothetical protein